MSKKRKKLCVVSGSRAEFGLLKNLIRLINEKSNFDLKTIVTGSHLSKVYGETYKDIISDQFKIDKLIDICLENDTSQGLTKSTAIALEKFSNVFDDIKPDLLIVLGDRYEILACVVAASFAKIPIAHIHGGEITEGLIDDAIRHSITKFSHLHFVAAEEYKKRVIQLGENPKKVFNVGGLGVDSIKNIKLFGKKQIEKELNIKFNKKNLLITFHPVTLEKNTSSQQTQELLNALDSLKDTSLIFTMPNADVDSLKIYNKILNFTKTRKNAYFFKSLGQKKYFSVVKQVDAVVGNSSSGLLEIPSFKKPTINIGDRQKGRIQAKSIINCMPKLSNIKKSINLIYKKEFFNDLNKTTNPYGKGGASTRIIKILNRENFNNLLKKKFNDLS